jgi:hypothetical protein
LTDVLGTCRDVRPQHLWLAHPRMDTSKTRNHFFVAIHHHSFLLSYRSAKPVPAPHAQHAGRT